MITELDKNQIDRKRASENTRIDPEPPLIRIHKITKQYGTSRPALDGVSFHVNRGEWLAVAGKSGSGKSTLINLIAGLDNPDSGEIIIQDLEIHTMHERERALWRGKNIGFVFQSFHLIPTLTVLENVLLAMDLAGKWKPSERVERAMDILHSLEIQELKDRFPGNLSGGEKQRTAIARAIANDPPLLLADEPTGNLDTHTATAVFEIFRRLIDEGRTLVMVTHDPEAKDRADRSLHIQDGRSIKDPDQGELK